MVSGRPAAGWTLATWREWAEKRRSPLREDVLAVLDELEREEQPLIERYFNRW